MKGSSPFCWFTGAPPTMALLLPVTALTAVVLLVSANRVVPPDHVQEFSCGRLYYRTFYMDRKREVLFVGGMDKVFRLNLASINRTKCNDRTLTANPNVVVSCVYKGKREDYECRNHIKVIQPIGDGSKLYICGTNAQNPRDLEIYSNNLTEVPKEHLTLRDIGRGIGKCPFDPDDNSTAIWVEKGNPGDLPGLYSGTVAEFTKADTVIFRSALFNRTTHEQEELFMRTLKYDSMWLDKPNFVGSFDIGDHVYYFFRESAVEYINCGKVIYSRVARVCKKDTGGKNILTHNWATFLKARLNCSIPGEYPFYFNEIQSVYKFPDDDNHIYAVFTTSLHGGPYGSAVCSFLLSDIQGVFAGKFKEQKTSSSAWLPVLTSQVPEPRPGLCVNSTKTLPDAVLNFLRTHTLMDSAVPQSRGPKAAGPVFYRENVVFLSLAVHRVEVDGVDYVVYYTGTRDGLVYKLVEWKDRSGEAFSNLVDVFEGSPGEPIRTMDISSVHKSLYVGSDDAVRQFSLHMCRGRHLSCVRCIRDPYCGWDQEHHECKPYVNGYLQDVTNSTPGICEKSIRRKQIHAYWGESIHLSCQAHHPDLLEPPGGASFLPSNRLPPQTLQWIHYSREKGRRVVMPKRDKYVHSQDHGLVVMALTERDAGRYDLHLDPIGTLCSYNVTVDTKTCAAPTETEYRKIYSDWCHEFEKYKHAMKTWQTKQAKCQGAHPNDVTYHGNPSA
ncbi:semaphorin-2A-like isoform X2 [Ornithodoros turicata]|uniref:semaphorin-2A-like isoform X2 n=1 Tax=Ornithodoros turicata TaxID=34597 RepID=UPI003139E641